MNFLETLRAHKGGLVCLKTELFWYGGRGWDGTRGRVCLLMDSAVDERDAGEVLDAFSDAGAPLDRIALTAAATLLLIDGCPHWVWVSADDLELLQPVCNPSPAVVYWHQVGGHHETG